MRNEDEQNEKKKQRVKNWRKKTQTWKSKMKKKKQSNEIRSNETWKSSWWWCRIFLSFLYPVNKNAQRCGRYSKYENELNFDGIDFPVRLQDIDKFTLQNNNIFINVYSYDEDKDNVYPLRVSTDIKEHHINLFLLNIILIIVTERQY